MISQRRKTGGMFFCDTQSEKDLRLYIDPGPGALVYSIKEGIELGKVDGILVTHAHLDHSNDAQAIIEAMTSGCKNNRGILMANTTTLNGLKTEEEEFTQVISSYHQDAMERVINVSKEKEFEIRGRTMKFLETIHGEPRTVAFKILSQENIGFVTDTELFEELIQFFSDCNYLIINVLRPMGKEWEGHLNINDVKKIISSIEPKKAVLQHFGYSMLYSSLKEQKEFLEKETGEDTEIIFAKDFQEVTFGEETEGLEKFMS